MAGRPNAQPFQPAQIVLGNQLSFTIHLLDPGCGGDDGIDFQQKSRRMEGSGGGRVVALDENCKEPYEDELVLISQASSQQRVCIRRVAIDTGTNPPNSHKEDSR